MKNHFLPPRPEETTASGGRRQGGARQTPRRFITLTDPSKVVSVVRQIQKNDSSFRNVPHLTRFFITLTFRRSHLVQNNKFKGLKKVVKFLIEERHSKFILIRRETTKKGDTHFHLASNTFCSIKDLKPYWVHGYIDIGPVRHERKAINYLFKGITCTSNELSLVVHRDLLKYVIV